MLILGIETSCDETSVAVVEDGLCIRSNLVSTQEKLHLKFGGVVPEIACRAHLESLLPILDEALKGAGVTLKDLDAIAVTNTPGLIGALLIGVTAAKALAWALRLPLIAINHLHAHIFASKLEYGHAPEFPCLSLVVSGGHTSLFLSNKETQHQLLGATLDDAAGEAFDKVAKLLGLGYPGGPAIDNIAREGSPAAILFPRSYLEPGSLDFSFSGLKTAVLYHYQELVGARRAVPLTPVPLTRKELADLAASFQEAVVDVLVEKTLLALRKHPVKGVALGGGVASNSRLRQKLARALEERHIQPYFPSPKLCTDNAAIVAGLAYYKYLERDMASLEVEAVA
ncbi:MAG TPA: tRNA (adenosine(37)-N6)-threonylcarbamoyltransferase complex transferase subunit TsaD [Candidatus Hypogeohydataceae bacterium YC41]